ncbi:siderochrome-iron transporter [Protomyces lactucae-debilis]|uniref:Siderochrome-iron transporter n=1 Tax=Protomyces lactucae-debilis TaxID=2754530 RepID=A0A1Y2FSA4_PROLT|nr:siderochrome-iron transporter [Protomyces lactucae-debilis]ORY86174.1 siderochrome-iron transporter [Protomyces lactucae-debilis]
MVSMSNSFRRESNAGVKQHDNFVTKTVSATAPDTKSPGVRRVEALASTYSSTAILFLLFAIFIAAYAYDLDGTIRYTYQSFATSELKVLGLLSTIGVLRSIIGAAAQPTFAKLADVFGRWELLCVSLFFYVLGTIVEATAKSINTFAAGVILFQVGFSGINIINTVLIGDMVSLRYRTLATVVPIMPYIVNVWISGNLTSSVLKVTTWRWGMGMFAIIMPVVSIPLIGQLWWKGRQAKKAGVLDGLFGSFHGLKWWQALIKFFWMLDVVGVILMIAVFALILTPLTLAGGVEDTWHKAHIIAPLVVGFVTIPFFVVWELYTKHPIIPFRMLNDRSVWGALGVGIFFDFAWYMQGDYLYTILIVAYDESILSATRITNLYTFVSTLTAVCVGIVVAHPRVQRIKPFILFGILMWFPAFGMLIYFRGDGTSRAGIIAAQVLLGFGAGFFTYPTLVSAQAAVKHEHLAVITGLYLAFFYIGSAFGNSVSGAVYTNLLPGQLQRNLARVSSNTTLASSVYASALTVALEYPIGTIERTAIVESYKHVQKILCIVGLCLCVPLAGFAFCLRDPKLVAKQSLKDDASVTSSETEGDFARDRA